MYSITVTVGSIRADEWLVLITAIFSRHGFSMFTGSSEIDFADGGLESLGIEGNVDERYVIFSVPDDSFGAVWGAFEDLRSEPWVREALRRAELRKVAFGKKGAYIESAYDMTAFIHLPLHGWALLPSSDPSKS